MRNKGFPLLVGIGMITLTSACDNVGWGGVQMEVRSPAPPPGAASELHSDALADSTGIPIETGPLLYLVERGDGSSATLTPIARITPDGYLPLPDLQDTPELVTRFALERWEGGSEFVLFDQGTRGGTFVSSGETLLDPLGCSVRPTAEGWVELHPASSGTRRFLALRKEDRENPVLPGAHPGIQLNANLRANALAMAGTVIPRVGAPWPPSIPEAQHDVSLFALGGGAIGLSTSLLYGDQLEVGAALPLGYSILALGAHQGSSFQPLWTWYQRADRGGKASARFAAAHDIRGTGEPDLLLEVFGAEARWWAVAGVREGGWDLVFQDGCSAPPDSGSIRAYPG